MSEITIIFSLLALGLVIGAMGWVGLINMIIKEIKSQNTPELENKQSPNKHVQ